MLPIQTAHHTFLESRHPKVTKIQIVLSPEGNQKVSAYELWVLAKMKNMKTERKSEGNFLILPLLFVSRI